MPMMRRERRPLVEKVNAGVRNIVVNGNEMNRGNRNQYQKVGCDNLVNLMRVVWNRDEDSLVWMEEEFRKGNCCGKYLCMNLQPITPFSISNPHPHRH